MVGVVEVPGPAAVIGDVHGRADLLEALLERLPPEVAVFTLGDVCDRGPDTRRCYDLLLARNVRGVRGNHEEWLLRWASGQGFEAFALSRAMGGAATLASYGVRSTVPAEIQAAWQQVPREHVAFIAGLPVALDLRIGPEKYWLVHAGVPGHVSFHGLKPEEVVPYLAEHHPEALLWSANEPETVPYLDRTVIMGHIPLPRPYRSPAVIAVDTGSGKYGDGRLTAVILPDRRFLSVG